MTKSVLSVVAFTLISVALIAPERALAQSEILAEMYGRGVHAYYSGDNATAHRFLSMAIDNDIQDPRAYYFRGLVANSMGNPYEAEADWKLGAEMESQGKANAAIGRSLARFQGAARLKLESIRQTARLEALASNAARSKARYGEIQDAESRVLRKPPQPAAAPPAVGAAPPAAAPPVAVAPPVAPAAADNPFADDMAVGAPSVESDDALAGAMENPFAGDVSIPVGEVPANDTVSPFGNDAGGAAPDPFGGAGGAAPDPFGGGSDAGGAAPDPFGGGTDAGGAAPDPFGGGTDAGGAMEDDPFGGNPFGS